MNNNVAATFVLVVLGYLLINICLMSGTGMLTFTHGDIHYKQEKYGWDCKKILTYLYFTTHCLLNNSNLYFDILYNYTVPMYSVGMQDLLSYFMYPAYFMRGCLIFSAFYIILRARRERRSRSSYSLR